MRDECGRRDIPGGALHDAPRPCEITLCEVDHRQILEHLQVVRREGEAELARCQSLGIATQPE